MAAALEIRALTCGYAGRAVLRDVSFAVEAGRAVVLLGPNGVGKSTLFKTVLGLLPALGGEVLVGGRAAAEMSRRELAQAVAYVPQTHEAGFGFTVREMVLMGTTPKLEGFATPTRADEEAAEAAMAQMGISELAARACDTLSGGEMQMVLIARALAQQASILVMDEPCANLDLSNQIVVLERVRALVAAGLTVVVTSHDPNHAFLLDCDVVCVGRGTGFAAGAAREVLTPAALQQLYGVEVGVGEICSPGGRRVTACASFMGGCGE